MKIVLVTTAKRMNQSAKVLEAHFAQSQEAGMSELFNRLICEWFHGGGSVTRDSNGRINWQCHRCGRWSAPVSHKEEAAMIDRDLANYRWKNEK